MKTTIERDGAKVVVMSGDQMTIYNSDQWDSAAKVISCIHEIVARERAEVARLRAALREIADIDGSKHQQGYEGCCGCIAEAIAKAEQALEAKP